MKITKQNFIIPIQDNDGNEFSIFLPHPNDIEISRISRVLSYILKETSVSVVSVIVDYERLIDESLMELPSDYKSNIKKALETFFNRCELSAKLSDGRDYHTLSDNEKDDIRDTFRGTLLFILALWRYSYREIMPQGASQERKELMKNLKQFFTSQNVMEWLDSLQNASAESQAQGLDMSQPHTKENVDIVKVSQT